MEDGPKCQEFELWYAERVVSVPGRYAPRRLLYEDWTLWCIAQGFKRWQTPLSRGDFTWMLCHGKGLNQVAQAGTMCCKDVALREPDGP